MWFNYKNSEFDFEKWLQELKNFKSEVTYYTTSNVSKIIWKGVLTPSELERRENESYKLPSFDELYPEVDTEESIKLREKYWL